MTTKKTVRRPRQSHSSPSAVEVARRANVSVMTVSRVFNGSAYVSPKTKEKVLAVAREIDYRPNLAARMLRTGKVEMIGFLLLNHGALQGHFHADSLAGFENELSKAGLNVILSIPPAGRDLPEWAHEIMRAGRCGGLVVQSDELNAEHLRDLQALPGPTVLLNYLPVNASEKCKVSAVGYNNVDGLKQAVRHLSALGHRRIAFIQGTPTHHDAMRRLEGFRLAMDELKIPINEDWIRPGDFTQAFDTGITQTDYLLAERKNGPTAIICASDEIAIGALHSARRCGRVVPRDLSIVGYDNIKSSAYTYPPLTTVEHDGWEIGAAVGKLIIEQVQHPKRKPICQTLETRLIVRQSTAIAPKT